MRRVASTFSVNNEFKDFQAGTRNGTVYPSRWLNDVQRELLGIQTAAGVSEGAGSDGRVLASIKKIWMDERRKPGTEYSGLVYREPAAFDVGDLDAYFNGICLDAIDGSQDFSDANWPDLVPAMRSVKMRSGARTVFNCVIVGQDIFLADSTDENNLISALAEWQVDFGSYTDWISVTVEGSEFPITGVFPATRRISVSGFPEQGTGTCEIYPHRVPGVAGSARVFYAQPRIKSFEGAENWTQQTSSFGANTILAVIYGNGLYVAVASSGKLATSPDGVTWTQQTSSFGTDTITDVTYGNGLYVAVGGSGKLATSPDGVTWTQRTSSFGTDTITGVNYGNGLYVAVGTSGKLATSPDGVTWTQRTSSFGTDTIFDATYGNGLYVAIGNSGKLATSPDGVTWTQQTSSFGTTQIIKATYGNGIYVAVGDLGKLATSPDGVTWTQQTSSFGTDTIFGVNYGNGLYVAVGGSGKLATSPSNKSSILSTPFYYKYIHGGRYVP